MLELSALVVRSYHLYLFFENIIGYVFCIRVKNLAYKDDMLFQKNTYSRTFFMGFL